MRTPLRLGIAAAFAFAPVAAFAQMGYGDPVIIDEPILEGGGITIEPGYDLEPSFGYDEEDDYVDEEDAREIAMMNGVVSIDDIELRSNGDYRIEGEDASGDDMEITIDGDTGDVLDIDN